MRLKRKTKFRQSNGLRVALPLLSRQAAANSSPVLGEVSEGRRGIWQRSNFIGCRLGCERSALSKLKNNKWTEIYLHTKRAGAGSTKLKVHKTRWFMHFCLITLTSPLSHFTFQFRIATNSYRRLKFSIFNPETAFSCRYRQIVFLPCLRGGAAGGGVYLSTFIQPAALGLGSARSTMPFKPYI